MVDVMAKSGWRQTTKGYGLLCWVMFVAGLLLAPSSQAKDVASAQAFAPHQVKAAYLYYFAKFTEWPKESEQVKAKEFTICLLGQDDIASALNSLAARTVHHQRVTWRRIDSSEAAASCHIVYLGADRKKNLESTVQKLKETPVLTISDCEGFSAAGGMVELAQVGNKIHFSINLQAVRQQNLRLNPYLLKLASIVEESP